MECGHATTCELLGLTAVGTAYMGRPSPIAVAAATAGTPRATILALAVLVGAAEDATSRQTWRSPSSDNRAYFMALTEWGYPLSEVEQLVLNPDAPAAATPAGALTDGAPNEDEVATGIALSEDHAEVLADGGVVGDTDGAGTDDADVDVDETSSGAA